MPAGWPNARSDEAGQPWAPWLFAPWPVPWPGSCSWAAPTARPAGRSGWSADRTWAPAPRGWAPELLAGRVRRDDAESAAVRLLFRAAPSRRSRRSLTARRFGVSRFAFMRRPSRSSALRRCAARRCTARNRTAALRGLRSISAASARSAPRVNDRNRGPCPGNSTGRSTGVREATASAKTRLTMRSSRDW